jgi:hypothetical protein
MATALLFPQVAINNVIKPEYSESYNRQLVKEDIDTIIDLCDKKDLQLIVDLFNVRKLQIYIADYYEAVELHSKILKKIAETDNFELFKFVHKKLCTDHKYYCLKDIKSNNQQIMNYKMKYITKVQDGFE